MEYKPFDRNLYNQNDLAAKTTAAGFLCSQGFTLLTPLQDQKEQYKAWDFQIQRDADQQLITVEAELKKVWTRSGSWQGFQTIDVPYRKKDSKANLFIMINQLQDTIAVTTMDLLKGSPVTKKKTIYTDNEPFFNVPLAYFRFYHKTKDSWIKIMP